MAKSAGLLNGFQYEIKDGPLAGDVVTMKDNKAVPDGQPNQRKVLVTSPEGKDHYILPRQLIPQPVGVGHLGVVTTPAPTFAPDPIPSGMVEVPREQLPESIQTQVPAGTTVLRFAPITDPMDPRLDSFRPLKSHIRQYEARAMKDGSFDWEFFLKFTQGAHRIENEGRPASISLNGETQSGKTLLVDVLAVKWSEQMAEEQRKAGVPVTYTKAMPIFLLSGSVGVTDFDLFGQVTSYTDPVTGQERLVWLPGIVELAAQAGGILYLDEYNAMQERVTSSLHSFLDSRHMFVNRNKAIWKDGQFMAEVVKAHPDTWIIGSRNDGYRGYGDPNEAFQNRFRHFPWDYDTSIESKLFKSETIVALAGFLRTARERKAIQTPVGTKALLKLKTDIEVFGPLMALDILVGMFKVSERKDVEAIINDQTILVSLIEEERQKALNSQANAQSVGNPLDDPSL